MFECLSARVRARQLNTTDYNHYTYVIRGDRLAQKFTWHNIVLFPSDIISHNCNIIAVGDTVTLHLDRATILDSFAEFCHLFPTRANQPMRPVHRWAIKKDTGSKPLWQFVDVPDRVNCSVINMSYNSLHVIAATSVVTALVLLQVRTTPVLMAVVASMSVYVTCGCARSHLIYVSNNLKPVLILLILYFMYA